MAAKALKIGVHLHFDPKFTMEFEHFDQKYFRQAYYPDTPLILHNVVYVGVKTGFLLVD